MNRRNVFLVSLVIVVILLFLFPSKISRTTNSYILKTMQPVTRSLVGFGRKVTNVFSIFAEINTLRSDNRRLTEDLIRAKVDNAQVEELQKENENFKQALEYKNSHPEMKLILSQIIGLDPLNFYDTLMVDKGSADGITEGMAVTYLGVLVGRIDLVTTNSSRVLLITSKDSIVQVMLADSRTTGILRGGISGMTLENIPLDTPISSGENVITSGLGGKLPKGIYVGNTGDEISAKSDIFKTIEVKSPVNFSKLENLFIVIGI